MLLEGRIPWYRRCGYTASLVVSVNPIYSALVEKKATLLWRQDLHDIAPPNSVKTYGVVDLQVSISPPQSESVKHVNSEVLIPESKFRNLRDVILWFSDPRRYRRSRSAAAIYVLSGGAENPLSVDTTKARSGQVSIIAYVSFPTCACYLFIKVESTPYPGEVDSSLPCISIGVNMKLASCKLNIAVHSET